MPRTNGQVKIPSRDLASGPPQSWLKEGQVLALIDELLAENSELTSRLKHVDSLKKLAELAVMEADREAARIRTGAEDAAKARANSIVTEAETRAREKLKQAEQRALQILGEAQRIAGATRKASEDEAARLLSDARQHVDAAREEAAGILDETYKKSRAAAEKNGQTERPIPSNEGHQAQPYPAGEASEPGLSLAELIIPGPVPLHHILRLHKHLARTHGLKVLDLKGSAGKGIRLKMSLPATMPVCDILECLPDFDVSGEIQEIIAPTADEKQDEPIRRFFVSVREERAGRII